MPVPLRHHVFLEGLASSLLLSSIAMGDPMPSGAPVPYPVSFSTGGSVGPDGPWNVINQTIDYPDQFVLMHPSLSRTSAYVSIAACQPSNASCVVPLPVLWKEDTAHSNFLFRDSQTFDAAKWDTISEPLGISGSGYYTSQRITLKPGGSNVIGNSAFVDDLAIAVMDNYSISYPGGAHYTPTVGFFSLYGGTETVSYKNKTGTTITLNHTLPNAFWQGYVPSISYGLHVGSAAYQIPGSLHIGAYDSARCLSDPLIANGTNSLQLKQLAFNVTSGGSAYSNIKNTPSGLSSTLQAVDLTIRLEPGAPYMYLPRPVCDSLAKYLPVTYSKDYNLYLWSTNVDSYKSIISSPHYLALSFASGSATATIKVPLALLSLNLTPPISTSTTAYFPCRPYNPSDGVTYILGRSFLQAAFLAQHWQAGKLWLAQAPGPYLPPGSVLPLDPPDQTAPAGNRVSWESTWSAVLKPLAAGSDSEHISNSSNNSSPAASEHRGLGTGAKIGIGGGVLALSACLLILTGFLYLRRKKKRSMEQANTAEALDHENLPYTGSSQDDHSPNSPTLRAELDGQFPLPLEMSIYRDPVELLGHEYPRHELPGD